MFGLILHFFQSVCTIFYYSFQIGFYGPAETIQKSRFSLIAWESSPPGSTGMKYDPSV